MMLKIMESLGERPQLQLMTVVKRTLRREKTAVMRSCWWCGVVSFPLSLVVISEDGGSYD